MRLLHHFRGRVLADRGTPLRCRNLVRWTSLEPGVEGALVSPDPSDEVESRLELEHFAIPRLSRSTATLQSACDRWQPDVVVAHTHSSAFELAALRTSALRVADLHGDLAAEKLENRQLPWLRRWKAAARATLGAARAFPRLDGFTVVSSALADRLQRHRRPVEVVLGGYDPALFRPAPPQPPKNLLTVGYAGSFRDYHGLPDLVEAVKRLAERRVDIELHLIGDAAQLAGFEERTRSSLGTRVTFHGSVAQTRVPELLARCDVLAVPRRAGRAAAHNYPSKLSEYLALGRAVIVTDVGEAATVVRAAGAGVVAAPGSAANLAAGLEQLADPDFRRQAAASGCEFALDQLAWPRIAAAVVRFLTATLEGRRAAA